MGCAVRRTDEGMLVLGIHLIKVGAAGRAASPAPQVTGGHGPCRVAPLSHPAHTEQTAARGRAGRVFQAGSVDRRRKLPYR